MNLFAYGTLMFPEVWDRVVGKPFKAEPATLAGFAVRRVRGDVYPVLVRAEGRNEIVSGLVYRELDELTMQRLDEYESDIYERVAVEAEFNCNRVTCEAYVLRSPNIARACAELWDPSQFRRTQLAAYLTRLGSFSGGA